MSHGPLSSGPFSWLGMSIPISPALINDATYLWRRRASKRLLVFVFIQKQKTLRTPICQDALDFGAGWLV